MQAVRRGAALVLAALLLHLVLILPNHPGAMTPGALRLVPLELPALLLGLLAMPPRARATRAVRTGIVVALVTLSVLKIADLSMQTAFSRAFNPVGDARLAVAGLRLLDGSLGAAATALVVVGACVALALAAALLWWATGRWSRVELRPAPRRLAGGAAVIAASVAVAEIGAATGRWSLPVDPPGPAFTARTGVEKARMVARTRADLREFDRLAEVDRFAGRDDLFDRIDRDVVVIFVESYGRSSIDVPLYAPTHRATLAAAEERLRERGLAMRSAYLRAPTRGGQSWLSHATVMNGLTVNTAARYSAALRSDRQTIYHLAAGSGFRTAAVMPAITLAWPEADTMGFDTVLPAADLGYRGLPFDWVTMPDQFTLGALDRLLRSDDGRPRLFAQVALASSHAPWTPVAEMVPWDQLGDGTIFDAQAQAGDPPSVVWRDRDRVRDQYRLAIDYSLRATFDWIAETDDAPLVVVIGDHPPAGFVARTSSPDTPVHLVGPPDLVARIADWGWSKGLIPEETAPRWPMAALRDRFVRAFTATEINNGATN
ncbi:sulfatase [Roseivivax marinus]|uniref:Sulfatase n=1 Tax=Roseivivax marinus TaxID=1379903 RepID=W4HPR6_9RHOB|nr:sulfatase [Roseivivax marinus]ETW14762.1 sulfatase [Roseivivax marinus]